MKFGIYPRLWCIVRSCLRQPPINPKRRTLVVTFYLSLFILPTESEIFGAILTMESKQKLYILVCCRTMSPLLPRPLSPYSLVLLAPTIPTCLAPSLNTEGIHIKFPTQNCNHGDHREQSQEPQSPKSKKATPAPAPAPTPLSTEAQNAAGILPASHWVTQPVSHPPRYLKSSYLACCGISFPQSYLHVSGGGSNMYQIMTMAVLLDPETERPNIERYIEFRHVSRVYHRFLGLERLRIPHHSWKNLSWRDG